LHKLDAADRDCRAVEPFEAKHWSDPLLDSPMILLDHVVQIFARSHADTLWQSSYLQSFSGHQQRNAALRGQDVSAKKSRTSRL
jgi:hypothetical protein